MIARARRAFRRLAAGRHATLVAFVVALAWSLAPLVRGVPEPRVHDEFGYLLIADTFLHGRLANPPHPAADWLETVHVLQHPTYAAKFPPAQGLVLAAGALATGVPLLGVKLAFALALAASVWMLQAWLPSRWALGTALLLAVQFGGFHYWSHGYWGGTVPLLGGALVLGALPRLTRRKSAWDPAALAAGAVVLMHSRPYEGFVLCALVGLTMVLGLAGLGARPRLGLRGVLAGGAILGAGFVTTAIYNAAVTGDPFLMPHHLFAMQHGGGGLTGVGDGVAGFRDPGLQAWWQHFVTEDTAMTFAGRLEMLRRSHLGFALLPALVALPWAMGRRRTRLAVLFIAAFLLATLPTAITLPHYAAPFSLLAFVVAVDCLRTVAASRVPCLRIVACVLVVAWVVQSVAMARTEYQIDSWHSRPAAWNQRRAALARRLESEGGQHLVVVRFPEGHDHGESWIQNGADIDGSRVVWARELRPSATPTLLAHFPGRTVWLLELTPLRPPHLRPLAGEAGPP